MVGSLRSKTDAGPVIEPEPRPLWLLLGNLQPLPSPDPLDPLHVHDPTGVTQQGRDPPVAIATILRGERDDVRGERLLVGTTVRNLPLCRSMLTEHPAGEPFGDPELLPDMIDTTTAPGGAQKFPEAASLRISFSSVRSDTAFRSRSFSFSSSFRRFTWFVFRPPYSFRHR